MKTKKISQRLILNKKTVANLNPGAMAELKGGCDKTSPLSGCGPYSNYTCLAETCPTDCYQTCLQETCATCL